jgi:hypothetical protein
MGIRRWRLRNAASLSTPLRALPGLPSHARTPPVKRPGLGCTVRSPCSCSRHYLTHSLEHAPHNASFMFPFTRVSSVQQGWYLKMLSLQRRPPMFTTLLSGLLGRVLVELTRWCRKTTEALKCVQVGRIELQNPYKHGCLGLEPKVNHPCSDFLPFYVHPSTAPCLLTLQLSTRAGSMRAPNNVALSLWTVGRLCFDLFVSLPRSNRFRSELVDANK